MRYLPVLFTALILAACSTAPVTNNGTRTPSPIQVLAPDPHGSSVDSAVQFLLTVAAADFRIHGPSGPLRFREVRIGHVVTPDSGKQYRLCGQFQRAAGEGKLEWMHFATITTSGYEQWIGGEVLSFCRDTLVIWDRVGDLSSSLQSRFDSLR